MRFDLRAWRTWAVLSQSELAELSGITVMTVSTLERGRTLASAPAIQRLAQAFGIPRTVLLHSTPEDEWARGWRPARQGKDTRLCERWSTTETGLCNPACGIAGDRRQSQQVSATSSRDC
jgi:transcriptional regulator with XRE-family HTH domain